ncbi:hypothetical protein E1B28_001568 [Marasmius oreades]|uniref:DUF6532 domain-containing protein n=1 Tax=Marasmius oreades TaxID=181124 RepID=A0A9P7V3R0_9AGAR|nr:uncharacterized protein E1B28_001568 [Marasmius oreades]KAG7099755.1 hypothetical protein E1B28_001568 [Marasmius oreades]
MNMSSSLKRSTSDSRPPSPPRKRFTPAFSFRTHLSESSLASKQHYDHQTRSNIVDAVLTPVSAHSRETGTPFYQCDMIAITKAEKEIDRLRDELYVANRKLEDEERELDSRTKTILNLLKEKDDMKENYEALLREKEAAISNLTARIGKDFPSRGHEEEENPPQDEDEDNISIIEITSSDSPQDDDYFERHSDEENTSDKEATSTPVQRRNTNETVSARLSNHRKKPALDAVLKSARHEYDARVVATCPFPNTSQQEGIARSCLEKTDISAIYSSDKSCLQSVFRKVNNVCGELIRSNVRKSVQQTYGFSMLNGTKKNESLYRRLVEDYAYVYKDPTKRTGIFENSIIQGILKFFLTQSNMRPFLLASNSIFNPIPRETIAFILTLVKFCLSEWQTGVHKKTKFYRIKNVGSYERLLNVLEGWEKHRRESSMKIRTNLYTMICACIEDEPVEV